MEKTTVSTDSLQTLLRWCEDAIDFRDETDAEAAKAWDELKQAVEK